MLANSALAGLVPCGTSENPDSCTLCDLWHLASNIVHFLIFYVAIPLAILAFVIAGVIYMTSAGSDTRVSLAHKIFRNAVIGVVIIFCAWLIVDTLIKTIAVNFNDVVWSWNSFPSCK